MTKEYILPVSILVAAVLIAGAVIWSAGVQSPVAGDQVGAGKPAVANSDALKLTADDVVLGDPKAPVTIVEYSDFQCPFCGRFFSQTESQVRENYIKTGKVKFVYRHFAFLGAESKAAAQAVECAKDRGKFWDYHDALFTAELRDGQENSGNLNRSLFVSLAKDAGLNTETFGACLDSKKYEGKVSHDYAVAQTLGVQATPTLFVNGQKIEGALPYDQFKTAIDQALAK